MNKLRKILVLALIVVVASIGMMGCKEKSEHPGHDHPDGEHPASEHPAEEAPAEDAPPAEHPEHPK
jgi:hypothetical protein